MAEKYISGSYSADAMGIGGDVHVELTVDQNKILKVKLDASCESFAIGQAAAPELAKQIMAKQSADIDAVSGASITSAAVKSAAQAALKKARQGQKPFNKMFDTLNGANDNCRVELMVRDGKIRRLRVRWHDPSQQKEAEAAAAEIISQQRLAAGDDQSRSRSQCCCRCCFKSSRSRYESMAASPARKIKKTFQPRNVFFI